MDWIKNLPQEFETWAGNAIDGFAKGITDHIPGLNDALNAIKKLFPQSPPQAGPLADVTVEKMDTYASDLMGGFASGIQSNVPQVTAALSTLSQFFPHSPVEAGPLAEVNSENMSNYGVELMGGLATGIKSGNNQVTSALQSVQNTINSGISASNLSGLGNASSSGIVDALNNAMTNNGTQIVSAIQQATAAGNNNSGVTNQPIQVNFHANSVVLPEGVTPAQATQIGKNLGDGVAQPINKGAISNGLKPNSIYTNQNIK